MYPKQLAPFKRIVATLLFGLIFAQFANAAEPRLRADGILFPVAPVGEKIATGSVEVMIAVDENGDTASVTVLSATHQKLEDAVLSAVKRWKFAPATSGGKTSIGMYRHAFRFENSKFVVDERLLEAFEGAPDEPKIRAEGVVLPELPKSLESVTGSVDLRVAVDGEGRVVDVITAKTTNAALEGVVKGAISQWRFDPVSRDGVPVCGIYKHTFRYEAGQEQFDGKLWNVLSAAAHVPTLRADGIVLPEIPAGVVPTGKTEVLVAVNGEGRVASVVSVASTDEKVAAAMKKAISAWRFDPALSNGRPVVGLYRHAFNFAGGRYVLSDEIWGALTRDPVEPELLPDGLELPKLPRSYATATGKFNLSVAVDLTGKVVDVMASSEAEAALVEHVALAVRKWSFRPANRGGQAAIGLFEYVFRYEDGEPLVGPKLWNAMRQAPSAPQPTAPVKVEAKSTAGGSSIVIAEPTELPPYGSKPAGSDNKIRDLAESGFGVARGYNPEVPVELRGISGQVNVIFDLSATGAVGKVTVEDYTHEELVESVIRVAHRWVFQPGGNSSATRVRVPFLFNEKRDERFVWTSLIDADFGNLGTRPEAIRSYTPSIPSNRRSTVGEVQALVAVDSYGYVTKVEIERGLERRIDKEAEEALYRWKFKPATVGGQAVGSKLRVTYLVGDGLASIDKGRYDAKPEPLSSPKPRLSGNDARAQGLVLLRLRIDEQGYVTDTRVVESTNPRLEGPSVDAIRGWQFAPAVRAGKAVSSTIVVPFVFPIDGV